MSARTTLDTLTSPIGTIPAEHFITAPHTSSARASVSVDFAGGAPETVYIVRERDALAMADAIAEARRAWRMVELAETVARTAVALWDARDPRLAKAVADAQAARETFVRAMARLAP